MITLATKVAELSTELPGRTSAYRIAEVRPQVDGIIRRRLFTEGAEVRAGQPLYEIDPARCTECVGHFDEPQCVQVCPVACIPLHPGHVESQQTLWQKFQRLQAASAVKDS